jgi:hypothetical protein
MGYSIAKNKLDSALMALEELLRADGYDSQSAYISNLRELYNSSKEADQSEFRRLITKEKFIWLGMGTIAEIVLSTDEQNQKFVQTYYDLAAECERLGFGSIYSRDVENFFGKQLRRN